MSGWVGPVYVRDDMRMRVEFWPRPPTLLFLQRLLIMPQTDAHNVMLPL
jgi:hypothetical protein